MTDIILFAPFLGSSDFLPAGSQGGPATYGEGRSSRHIKKQPMALSDVSRESSSCFAEGLGHGKIIPPLNLACLY